jgi:hypothetical protein
LRGNERKIILSGGGNGRVTAMTIRFLQFCLVLAALGAIGTVSHASDCSRLQGLAQQHAYDMARRERLDHSGFMRQRGPAGVRAENVAVGCADEACARRTWMRSAPHRRNMTSGGCQAIASAVSKSGRRYWVMEVGAGGDQFSVEDVR